MGKKSRDERRRAARQSEALAVRRGAGTSAVRWVAAGIVVVAIVLVALGAGYVFLSNQTPSAAQIPSGTSTFDESNHQHVTGSVSYDHTPPAGGAHNGVWLNCGVYDQPVPNVNAIHSLEHGAVWITYQPSLSQADVTQLRQFAESHYDGNQKYVILSPYSGIPAPVVASAWGAQIQLTGPSDPRLAQFVAHYGGGAQGGEPGGACTGGTGTPLG